MFIAVAFLIALAPLAMMVRVVGRVRWISRALNGGVRAEGRCVRAYTTVSRPVDGPTRSRQHFVFEFTTAEGRQVRFEDGEAPSTTIEGDYVTVAYVPERPEKATVVREGGRTPYAKAALTLVVLGVFLAVVVAIGASGFGMFSDSGDFPSGF
ncbi:DUF3592 domain-containing protein [Streptomyces sp. NPDC059373]